jgi:hypothetical protein
MATTDTNALISARSATHSVAMIGKIMQAVQKANEIKRIRNETQQKKNRSYFSYFQHRTLGLQCIGCFFLLMFCLLMFSFPELESKNVLFDPDFPLLAVTTGLLFIIRMRHEELMPTSHSKKND